MRCRVFTSHRRAPIMVTVAVVLVLAIVGAIGAMSVKPLSLLLSVSVGDHFTFGSYPQGKNGEVQPIEWRVLAVKDGRVLVITEKLLDGKPYHTKEDEFVTWETCTLREWMNNDFFMEAFSTSEQEKIPTVANRNPSPPECRTDGGNATEDRIFALSTDEAEEYFRNDDDRMAEPTEYAVKNGIWASNDYSPSSGKKTGCWWLSSPGHYRSIAAIADYHGRIYHCGNYVYSRDVAVRPACWLNL